MYDFKKSMINVYIYIRTYVFIYIYIYIKYVCILYTYTIVCFLCITVTKSSASLYTSDESNLRDRVLGEVEKKSFIALPGKGGHNGLLPRKTVSQPGRI